MARATRACFCSMFCLGCVGKVSLFFYFCSSILKYVPRVFLLCIFFRTIFHFRIERKSGTRLNPEANLSLLHPYPEAFHLALVIAEWGDIHDTLAQSLDPYPLVNYLFHLAAEIGQANRVFRVKDMEASVAEARWLLFWCAKRVLEHGLTLLGLESVEQM